jgi:uncharacterized protein (TIGR03435 family)
MRTLTLRIVALAALMSGALHAQSPVPDWQTAAGGKMAFDVASVKQNKTDEKAKTNIPMGAGNVYSPTGGVFSASNMPLIVYMAFAYKLTSNDWATLRDHVPDWVTSDRFDIEAKSENVNPTKDQVRLMMQALLAERFKLVLHQETQQLPVFAMVLVKPDKLGPHLQQHPADATCPMDAPAAPSESQTSLPKVAGGYPATCGGVMGMPGTAQGHYFFGGRNVPLGLVASAFGGMPEVGRPILDQTGLTGKFDFTLDFSPQNTSAAAAANDNGQSDPAGASFLEALKEQLGLKLVATKGPVSIFVVDHVEHPSAN